MSMNEMGTQNHKETVPHRVVIKIKYISDYPAPSRPTTPAPQGE